VLWKKGVDNTILPQHLEADCSTLLLRDQVILRSVGEKTQQFLTAVLRSTIQRRVGKLTQMLCFFKHYAFIIAA
jgi:hypothetical protein